MAVVEDDWIAQRAAEPLRIVDVARFESDGRQRIVLGHAAIVRGRDPGQHAFRAQRLGIARGVVFLVVAALGKQCGERELFPERRQAVGRCRRNGAHAGRHPFDAGAERERLALDLKDHVARAIGGGWRLYRGVDLHARLLRQHVDVVLEALLPQWPVLFQLLGNVAQTRFRRTRFATDRDIGHVAFHDGDQHVAILERLGRHECE